MDNLHLHALRFCKESDQPEGCEHFIRALLDSMDEGVLVLDTDYRILRTNRSYSEILGKRQNEIIGRFCYEVTHQSSIPCWEIPGSSHFCPTKEAIETGKPVSAVHSHYDQDKRLHYVEIKAHPLKDYHGKICQIIETHADITDRKTLEAHLHQAAKMESLGNMAGGIAHDLNNILTPILGNSELALQRIPLTDPYYEYFKEIHSAARKARDLVSHILAFSRRQLLEMTPLDLNQVITNLNRFLHRVIRKDITIEEYLAENIHTINADQTQLEQVVMNLVVNAGDAMPEGGKILIETSRIDALDTTCSTCGEPMTGTYSVLQVSDKGTGIAPEIMPHIFEPFFTTKEAGTGTGMGLATIVGIAHQHNGHINVYSEPGKGSTFKVYFPGIAAEKIDTQSKSSPQPACDNFQGSGENILVVDDDKSVRQVLEKILTRFGYLVSTAEDGEKALELFSRLDERPVLVVTDLVMPGMNGKELITRIQDIEPETRALYMSGYSLNTIHHNFTLNRDINHIQKPLTVEGVISEVKRLLIETR